MREEGATSGGRRLLILEVEPDTEPVTGSLRGPEGESREFEGYLELMSAIEALRDPNVTRSLTPAE